MSFDFGIVSSMDRDDLYAELMWDNVQWGEIAIEQLSGLLKLTLYPSPDGRPWVFDLLAAQGVLEAASKRLLEVEGANAHKQS